ncbi:hypothetical protein FEZ51_05910 [Pediococcus stilesii]|uniref:ABC transporter permease n=1 Tax=Pediococcus stilesii TaxID=331679 RepID=A0A5R9BUG9_9LACO|nr:ABC transporter permease [Pediococcus stilesii]TLQ04334.1 hypothetical protein FEZ51_05910 [Pediococcus stilesii]
MIKLRTEFLKVRGLKLSVIILATNVIACLIGSLLYFQNQGVFIEYHTQWYALCSESGMFYSQLFFPLLIAILASVIIHIEKERKNFDKLILIPISAREVALTKLKLMLFLTVFSMGIFLLIFYMIGIISGLPQKENTYIFVLWGIMAWVGTAPIVAFQLWISIIRDSFTSPIMIALILSLLNFVLLTVFPTLVEYYPYSQIMVGMNVRSYISPTIWGWIRFMIINLILATGGIGLSVHSLKKIGFE